MRKTEEGGGKGRKRKEEGKEEVRSKKENMKRKEA